MRRMKGIICILWTMTATFSAVKQSSAQLTFPASSFSGMYGQPNPGAFYPGQPSPLLSRQVPFTANVNFGSMLSSPQFQDEMVMRPGLHSPGGFHPVPSGSLNNGLSAADLASQEQPFGRLSPASMFAARRASLFGMAGGSMGGPYDVPGGRPDTSDGMQPFPMQMDNTGIPSANGLPPFTMTGSPFRGDGTGVSYFPIGRFRPGAEILMMGVKPEQEEANAGDQLPAGVAPLNETGSKNETLSSASNDSGKHAFVENKPVHNSGESARKSAGDVTVSTTLTPQTKTQTSSPACAHPVYMNRVFMSTALSMGLLSANASCIILVDH